MKAGTTDVRFQHEMKSKAIDQSRWIREALERYQRPLIRYAYRITGDLERARDIVQDTFLRLCRQPAESVQDHLAQWLYKVCRNRALDVLKQENRMTSLDIMPTAVWESSAPNPSARLERREQLQHVAQILDDLSENQREVVRFRFEGALSYREISQVTGLSVSNVGFLLHTALKNIRERMQQSAPSSRSHIRRAK